ncbi:YgiT-type zinc finger protein [Deltaproteobacteria bacterium TL4]
MICPSCQTDRAREILTTQVVKTMSGSTVIIDKVPLISCKNCGESFYNPDAIKKMDEIRENPDGGIEKTFKYFDLTA